ncbi:glycosyltransferase family 4 protein [Defluviitoga tunisiensis]|uniref:Group 1 glycosyl transferase n=1 Tax=Defluviitoga tunisiensis TaxID=1006576 RepID=A0A0C7NR56_DEFTU|nr:glycosyltransferase family 4 protein [Defluviitoga tunisiensis]CEP78302.1 group 1 glycosyl transferase [Defluviitoga tunisiensis]
MRVLFITNLFPYPQNPTSGVFITNRLKALRNLEVDFDAYGLISQDSSTVKLARKVLGKKGISVNEAFYEVNGIKYKFAFFNRNIYDVFSDKILKRNKVYFYSENAANQIFNNSKEFDIIHAHGMYNLPAGLVAKLVSEKLKVPYVITCHGSDINLAMPNNKELYNNVLEQAGKVIFVSNALLNKAKSLGYSGKNAVVIPNGMEPETFKPLDKEKIKRELGLSKKVVGFVGNLVFIKRADKFPEIFENISSNKDVEFLVVGDGELRENIEKECQKRNLNVKFVGRVSQDKVPYYMNAMDVMILPSKNEGWPCVVLEAQACGVPVVGSSNGGIPEAIGDGGIVIEEGEDFEKRFADAVVELLKNPIERDYLRERALGFSWENIVKQEVAVYEEVLKK